METSSWQTIWFYLFFIASLMFYGTVTIVAFKGIGDVTAMIGKMIKGRRQPPGVTSCENNTRRIT